MEALRGDAERAGHIDDVGLGGSMAPQNIFRGVEDFFRRELRVVHRISGLLRLLSSMAVICTG